jgi:hypothetical protein
MHNPGQHVRIRLDSDRLLHSSDPQRRGLARSVHKAAKPWPLLSFGCAGSHLHLVVATDHRGAGELARRLEISLQLRHDYGSPFQRVHRRPLEDQRHVFSASLYDMRQREHHALASDPFLEATSAPDLLGARVLGAHLIPRANELLPELRRGHLLQLYGIDDLLEAEAWDDALEVVEAALAAFALADLRGSSADVRRARVVVVALVGPDLSAREIAALLCCSPRTVERLRQAPPPDQLVLRAVRLQIDLRRRVGALQGDPSID